MRVVILGAGTVGKDDIFFNNLDLSSCGMPSNVWALQWNEKNDNKGHIEFNTPTPNENITSLPAWANSCLAVWQVAYDASIAPPPAPTPEQIIAENKAKAEDLLSLSDWSVLPDVPLANRQSWETYRAAVRTIAINPTLNPVWPTKPEIIWQ
jgi:hypothetical protein